MKILITGAKGFVGKNLVENLKAIRDFKNHTRPQLKIDEIFEYDLDSTAEQLDDYCSRADFVFNLAGVNRPTETSEFMRGNFGFAETLLKTLKKHQNVCPVMLSSSIQASLKGPYANSEYGKSKLEGERLFFNYGEESGAKILVYRFPNLFGKWCRPSYNSVVATFCNNVANDLPIQINDRETQLSLVYIDDLLTEMLDALEGKPHMDGIYCYVPTVHEVKLGEIADMLEEFNMQPQNLIMPDIPDKSFKKKLYSTYLSYLPKEKIKFELKSNTDSRGSFTELLKTENSGQFSVNVSKPGITKGQHWHNSKWELFIVLSGRARIEERKIGGNEVFSFDVSGDKIEAVHMLPGYTHSITNLSDTEDLITLMWANEQFNKNAPDTFAEEV